MKKSLIAIFTCFSICVGFAQEFTTETSSHFKKESEKDVYSIVLPSAYGFTTLHHLDNVMMDNTKAMVLTRYDQAMQSVETKTFNLPKLGLRASDLKEVVELDTQLVFLSTVMHKKMAKHEVNAQVYSGKENTVSENKVLASFPIDGYSKSGFYQIAVSEDKSKIAIVANMPFVKKTNEKVKIWVYDNELNLLWEQTETIDYKSERAYQEKVFVQNSGVVIMSKTIDAFKKTRKSVLITFNGAAVENQDFSSPGFLPMEMKLIEVNGQPMFSGFFWNGKKTVIKINSKVGKDNDGAFLYDLNESNLIGIHEWSENLDARDLKSLSVVDVKVLGDDIYMIGEKQLQDSAFRKTGSTTSSEIDYSYTFGSSVIVNFDTKGTLKSFTPIKDSNQYKNGEKEKGSMAALFLENGYRVFSNYSKYKNLSFTTYFTEAIGRFKSPKIMPYDGSSMTTPYVLPKTIKPVKNYGMVYFITNYGDRYYLNKMTW